MNWTVTVIICIVLALFTIWKEYSRTNRTRLIWRIIASVVAIAALAGVALPISYQGKKERRAGDNPAALLTGGYSSDSISNIYKVIFTTDRDIKKAYPKAVFISSLQEVSRYQPAVNTLHILGYGLNTDELNQLTNVKAVYHAPVIPTGIQTISWSGKLKTGEPLQVQGKFNNTSSAPVKLILKGLNTGLDSLTIAAGKTANFGLTTIPKSTGRVTYNLLAVAGDDTLANETLPVTINTVKPVKVLMLSASPDFETNFLKNWLSSNGYSVAARAVISKDKISQDFINLEKQPLEHLTPALLAQFDAVIGDLSTLKSLNGTESSALKQQVTQKGLGVIIRSDSSDKATSWLQRDFPVNTVPSKAQLSSILRLQNRQSKTAVLTLDPSYISTRNNTQNLVYDAQNHFVASSALAGAGRLVFTTLNHTYTWALGGNGKDYSTLWSLLIGKATRKLPATTNWQVVSATPAVNEPVNLSWQSATAPPSITINHTVVAPQQNPVVPYEWNITYWPQKAGWQQSAASNSTDYWYNYPKSSWSTIKNSKKIADTKNYIENQPKVLSVTKQIQQSVQIEVPKIYFYLLLLAACTFLWIEHKLAA